jgi:hypothetical protein
MDFIGGDGFALVPDYSMSTGYDYFEVEDVFSKVKRYSFGLIPSLVNAGYYEFNGDKIYDAKVCLGMYDTMMMYAGAFNITSESDDINYYVSGTFFLDQTATFTGAYFYKDGEFQWGWAYNQPLAEGLSYIIEKRGGMRNRGYRINMGPNLFYENIELDVQNNYNLRGKKYKSIVYKVGY